MALPTVQSSGDALKARFDKVVSAMERARTLSVSQKAVLIGGNTPIQTIIDAIYLPFARSTAQGGFFHLISDLSGPCARSAFKRYRPVELPSQVGISHVEVGFNASLADEYRLCRWRRSFC